MAIMVSFYLDNTAFYCISQVYHVAVNPTNSGAVQLDSTNIDATLGKKRYFACKWYWFCLNVKAKNFGMKETMYLYGLYQLRKALGKFIYSLLLNYVPYSSFIFLHTLSFLITDRARSVWIQQKACHLAEMYKKYSK